MGLGNSKSKKAKEPDKFFDREKMKELEWEDKRKKKHKRVAVLEPALPPVVAPPPAPSGVPSVSAAQMRSFDENALELMRYQLRNDADAFLLNNILLSVQFFENYEREMQHIKNNPISEREHIINEAMVHHNKHVFFADCTQEKVNEHVVFQKVLRGLSEHLTSPRIFIFYDNVESSEPGDTSDYSAVMDAPFYKLLIQNCKEPGYIKLKKLEVLESTLSKDNDVIQNNKTESDDSLYADSEKESIDSDEPRFSAKGKALQKIKSRIDASYQEPIEINLQLNPNTLENSGRRRSGPIKQVSLQAENNNIMNMKKLGKKEDKLPEDNKDFADLKSENIPPSEDIDAKPRKSILKSARRLSGPIPGRKSKQNFDFKLSSSQNAINEDTETSGYRSNSSSVKNDMSESESDYGYATITESTTPRKIELSSLSNDSQSTGVLPDETWAAIETRAVDWTDDEEIDDSASRLSLSRNLYETHHFLCSTGFMNNFVDNFIMKLGNVLGLSQDAIKNTLSQGASVYCDTLINGIKTVNEVVPALIANWPNVANQWIIRERRIIENPRTNHKYQWPTKYMVSKAIGFGCVLVPIGFRPKRGVNSNQKLQWKILFPAVERYLESCLAHAHVRCYLFALVLHRSFIENDTSNSKIGVDASHLKNHLFWQCEDNYAKWPEHRLGETLRIFLRSFYTHLGQRRFPNYFIESCNDFKGIPKPLLLLQQRRLADILESPVMHLLSAIDKLKYIKKDFYPPLNVQRLYDILTTKNPLRILNPNLPMPIANNADNTDSEDEISDTNFWEKAKRQDKNYQWKKEKQRQLNERRKVQFNTRKQRASMQQEKELKTNIILPAKMDPERRRIVVEFFIPHFIAMARSSEKFDAIRQAVIYLEQAQRLSILLKDEPGGEYSANEYLDVIRDKLVDCQTKLVTQSGYKIPPRRDSFVERERAVPSKPIQKSRLKYENITSQNSPGDNAGFSAFTFVEVHAENSSGQNAVRIGNTDEEESKL